MLNFRKKKAHVWHKSQLIKKTKCTGEKKAVGKKRNYGGSSEDNNANINSRFFSKS